MKALYLAIRAQILANCPSIKHVRLFNDQFNNMENREQIPFNFPCVFVEFPSDIQWTKLGNGVRVAESLLVRIHIGHENYNNLEQEENLLVFDIRDEVLKAMEDFYANCITSFVNIAERTDITHTDVYVLQQDYLTNYRETLTDRIRGGITINPPFTLVTPAIYIAP